MSEPKSVNWKFKISCSFWLLKLKVKWSGLYSLSECSNVTLIQLETPFIFSQLCISLRFITQSILYGFPFINKSCPFANSLLTINIWFVLFFILLLKSNPTSTKKKKNTIFMFIKKIYDVNVFNINFYQI